MKNLLALIAALTPLVQVAMPLLILLGGWWINKQNKKTAADVKQDFKATTAAQTVELKEHSDANRDKTISTVVSASGTFKALPEKGSGP